MNKALRTIYSHCLKGKGNLYKAPGSECIEIIEPRGTYSMYRIILNPSSGEITNIVDSVA